MFDKYVVLLFFSSSSVGSFLESIFRLNSMFLLLERRGDDGIKSIRIVRSFFEISTSSVCISINFSLIDLFKTNLISAGNRRRINNEIVLLMKHKTGLIFLVSLLKSHSIEKNHDSDWVFERCSWQWFAHLNIAFYCSTNRWWLFVTVSQLFFFTNDRIRST